jgi:DNA topoisomerase IB
VHAQNFILYKGRYRKYIKKLNELLPKLYRMPSLALVKEPINSRDILALVVPPKHENSLRVLDFISQEQTDCLYALLASIHIVP